MGPRRGVSVALGTVILGGTILIAVFGAVFVSGQMVEVQAQLVEFEQAKATLQLFATSAEDVALKPKSASHAVVHTRSGGIWFMRNIGRGNLTVNDYNNPNVVVQALFTNKPVNQLRYAGGRLVSVPSLGYLRGNGSLILKGFIDPLGNVFTNQSNGAWAVFDYNRVRVVRHGSFYVHTQAGGTEKVNLIEVTFVNMDFGESKGTGTVRMRVENINITTTAYRFAQNITIAFSSTLRPTAQNARPCCPEASGDVATVVNFVQVYVRVTTQ